MLVRNHNIKKPLSTPISATYV